MAHTKETIRLVQKLEAISTRIENSIVRDQRKRCSAYCSKFLLFNLLF